MSRTLARLAASLVALAAGTAAAAVALIELQHVLGL